MRLRTHKRIFRLIGLILLMAVITGCTTVKSSSDNTLTGFVTSQTITDTVESSGAVSAKHIATLDWSTSGKVLDVNVQSSDAVTSGEELMKLESTSAPTDVLEAISTLVTAKQTLEDAQVSKTSLAEAEQALLEAQKTYDEARKEYLMKDEPIAPEDFTVSLKLAYIKAQQATERALRAYNQYGDNVESPHDPSYYPKFAAYAALCQARINEADALTRLTHFTNPLTKVLADKVVGEYNLAKEQLDAAQRTYDEINAGNVNAIKVAQAAVDAAQTTVNKLSIIAPFDGVVAVVYSQPGDIVSSGTDALVLVDRSTLYVDVLVDEDSIAKVNAGDPVDITFSALDITTTGTVTFIDPIGVSSNNVVNYTVRITLDDNNPQILVGATATTVITTGKPHEVIYVPVSAVLVDDQGEYVIRIKEDGSTERVAVVSSNITNGKVEVTGDLNKGDMLQLAETTTSTTSTSNSNNGGGLFGMGRFLR